MEKAREYRERQRERDQAIEEKKRKKKEERENTVCKYYVEGNCAKVGTESLLCKVHGIYQC